MPKEARPYQSGAFNAALERLEHVRAVLLILATGLGKSFIIALLAKHFSRFGRILVLEPRRKLVQQVAAEMAESSGLTVGIEMAKKTCATGERPEVVVASINTISQPKRLEAYERDAFALVIVDECFPAGTRVDDRRIEQVRRGDLVASFNHQTGRVERRRVERVFSSRPSALVRVVLSDGSAIVCTPGHPFFTRGQYVPAFSLKKGDVLYGNPD